MSAIESSGRRVDVEDLWLAKIFQELDDDEMSELSHWFVELRVPSEETIVRAAERSDAFFVLVEGKVALFHDVVGQPVQFLAHLHPGDFFGELGLFGVGEQTVSVRATEPCRVLKIEKGDLLAFLEEHPSVKRKLQATASYRYTSHVAATLELARRREVRIGFRHPVKLKPKDGEERWAYLQNLSLGGLSLDGAPESWEPGKRVGLVLGFKIGELHLTGRIAWRRGERIGMVFEKNHPNHDMLIQLTIRMLLESAN